MNTPTGKMAIQELKAQLENTSKKLLKVKTKRQSITEGKSRRLTFSGGDMTSSMIHTNISTPIHKKLHLNRMNTLKDTGIATIEEDPIELDNLPKNPSKPQDPNQTPKLSLLNLNPDPMDSVQKAKITLENNPIAATLINSDLDDSSTDSEQQMAELKLNVAHMDRILHQIETGNEAVQGFNFDIADLIGAFGKKN
jgi:hypothetical protein